MALSSAYGYIHQQEHRNNNLIFSNELFFFFVNRRRLQLNYYFSEYVIQTSCINENGKCPTLFIGECENSSLKAFNSCKKTVKFINHLMGRITRESVRVSVQCTYIYIYRTLSETVFTTYMQFVHLKIYWKVHNIMNYNDRIIFVL